MDLLKKFLTEAGKWDPEEFARVWNDSDSREAVATRYGITPSHASMRATQLRNAGIELKKHTRGRKLGTKLQQTHQLKGKLPSKAEFIQLWNKTRSITKIATDLEISPFIVKKLIQKLRDDGYELSDHSGPGRSRLLDLDERTLAQIWQASESLDEVIGKVQEMGYDFPAKQLRAYLTSMKYRINMVRKAAGKPLLKTLERPAYHKRIEFADKDVPDVEDGPWDDEKTDPDLDVMNFSDDESDDEKTNPGFEPDFNPDDVDDIYRQK